MSTPQVEAYVQVGASVGGSRLGDYEIYDDAAKKDVIQKLTAATGDICAGKCSIGFDVALGSVGSEHYIIDLQLNGTMGDAKDDEALLDEIRSAIGHALDPYFVPPVPPPGEEDHYGSLWKKTVRVDRPRSTDDIKANVLYATQLPNDNIFYSVWGEGLKNPIAVVGNETVHYEQSNRSLKEPLNPLSIFDPNLYWINQYDRRIKGPLSTRLHIKKEDFDMATATTIVHKQQ